MMRLLARAVLSAVFVVVVSGTVHADDADFLNSLEGNWQGKGTVKVRTNAPTIRVSCKFTSNTSADSLSLDGNCRGLLVFSRKISADLKLDGDSYAGSYVGAGTGTAGLSGSRVGDALELGIRWAKKVNGDRDAWLTVQKDGENGMRLITTDVDPKTGENVVTSEINLKRT